MQLTHGLKPPGFNHWTYQMKSRFQNLLSNATCTATYWHSKPKALADNSKDNHGISSQKFHMLREFLGGGCTS
jgi:hypothetical protein